MIGKGGVGIALDEREVGVSALGVEIQRRGESLDKRGLAAAVLANEEGRLGVERQGLAQGADGGKGKGERAPVGRSGGVDLDPAQERIAIHSAHGKG